MTSTKSQTSTKLSILVPKLRLGTGILEAPLPAFRSGASRRVFPSGAWEQGAWFTPFRPFHAWSFEIVCHLVLGFCWFSAAAAAQEKLLQPLDGRQSRQLLLENF